MTIVTVTPDILSNQARITSTTAADREGTMGSAASPTRTPSAPRLRPSDPKCARNGQRLGMIDGAVSTAETSLSIPQLYGGRRALHEVLIRTSRRTGTTSQDR